MSPSTAVEPHRPSAVATPVDDDDDGLGDFNTNVIPRLSITPQGTFKNNLTNEELTEVDAVILGMVRQRVLWPPEVSDGEQKPLCRSYDGAIGRPLDGFPASKAKGVADLGDGSLDCSTCPLKEWESHPTRSNVPWCSEQIVLPLLIDGVAPALLTLQRSALKPINAYLSDFKRRKTGAFTHVTRMTLTKQKRGSVDYAVPTFTKSEPTDEDLHDGYRAQFRSIRDFLKTPRVEDESDEGAPAASTASSTAADFDDTGEVPF